jgi:AcrR family transcriptional regulator
VPTHSLPTHSLPNSGAPAVSASGKKSGGMPGGKSSGSKRSGDKSSAGARSAGKRTAGKAAQSAGSDDDDGSARFVNRAVRWIHSGRRLDMQGLADELGVSRATLFRRAGGREELLAKALWSLTERTLQVASERWEAERPEGALHTPGTGRHINAIVAHSEGLRRLLDDEPALALRVLTDPRGRVQTGIVTFVEALLHRDMAEFGLMPLIEPGALAYALVRLGESFIYADALANRQPDVVTADRLQQALVEGITHHPAAAQM